MHNTWVFSLSGGKGWSAATRWRSYSENHLCWAARASPATRGSLRNRRREQIWHFSPYESLSVPNLYIRQWLNCRTMCVFSFMQQSCLPVISMAFSEVRFSVLPRSPAGPPGPNAAISSTSDRPPALWDLLQRNMTQRQGVYSFPSFY